MSTLRRKQLKLAQKSIIKIFLHFIVGMHHAHFINAPSLQYHKIKQQMLKFSQQDSIFLSSNTFFPVEVQVYMLIYTYERWFFFSEKFNNLPR